MVSIAVEDVNGIEYYTPYQDHLGSITMVTDATATVVFEQNFDAWGRLRNPNDWSYTNVPDIGGGNLWAYRGYTFHEHLPEFGLINMNGRMYDPILGRMLSPDNYVQSPFSTQSYNRYSYVWNNPLKYSDPSGEWIHLAIGGIRGGTIAFIEGRSSGLTGWQLAGYTALGTGMGVASAYLNPASIVGQGFYLKPDLASGSHGGGIGIEAGFNFGYGNDKTISFGGNASAAVYYSPRHQGTGIGGVYGRGSLSLGVSVGNGFGVELFTNQYLGGAISQRTGGIRLGFGEINNFGYRPFYLTYENDFMFGMPIADNGDRYRSAAMRLQYYGSGNQPFEVGFNLFTGDPGLAQGTQRLNNTYNGTGVHAGYKVYNEDNQYRLGSLHIGYGNLKVGWDSERIRHVIQNKGAHDAIGVPHFQVIDKTPRFYWYFGNNSNYSLWGY